MRHYSSVYARSLSRSLALADHFITLQAATQHEGGISTEAAADATLERVSAGAVVSPTKRDKYWSINDKAKEVMAVEGKRVTRGEVRRIVEPPPPPPSSDGAQPPKKRACTLD